MRAASIAALFLLAPTPTLQAAINQSCAAGGDSATFIHIHGRLGVYNGGYPNLRIWQIGANHLFGIYGGPADLRCERGGTCKEAQDTNLPSNLEKLDLLNFWTYGDFVLRPLESFRAGHQQAACIVSVDHLVRRPN